MIFSLQYLFILCSNIYINNYVVIEVVFIYTKMKTIKICFRNNICIYSLKTKQKESKRKRERATITKRLEIIFKNILFQQQSSKNINNFRLT